MGTLHGVSSCGLRLADGQHTSGSTRATPARRHALGATQRHALTISLGRRQAARRQGAQLRPPDRTQRVVDSRHPPGW